VEFILVTSLLNKIVIGTAQFGLDYGINNKSGKVSKDEVYKILDLLKESGIEFIDTAQAYGDSEFVLGSYLKERNISFQIVSKLQNCTHEEVGIKVQESLERLHIKSLYGILLHSFDTHLKNPLTYKKLSSLKETGIVNKVGFSLYFPNQLTKILEDNIEVDIVQIPYNLFDRRFEKYLPMLKERDIEIHVRSVFLQGLFFMKPKDLLPNLQEFSRYISLLEKLSLELKISIHELALLFVISNQLIDKAVVGIDNVNHLKDIINVLNNNNKFELVSSQKHTFSKLEVENEAILIPSNWN
jgi:aryl-alcohol dehydrogenase-like predicted oxidoreductase